MLQVSTKLLKNLQEIVEFLKNPGKFTALAAEFLKEFCALAPQEQVKHLSPKLSQAKPTVPFFSISGSDFVEMFVGVGASRIRDLFDQAKKNAPCIVFIDEIDAVGRHRGAGIGGGHDEREQTLNQLLVEMDGFDTNEGVILMAATNRPDVLIKPCCAQAVLTGVSSLACPILKDVMTFSKFMRARLKWILLLT